MRRQVELSENIAKLNGTCGFIHQDAKMAILCKNHWIVVEDTETQL